MRKVWYNTSYLDEQNTGALCFLDTAAFSQSDIVGKVPSTCGLMSLAVRLGNGSARGGHFVMRNNKGQFIDGSDGMATRFKKGEHWRKQKPYWNRAWLYNEYVIKGKSTGEIANDWNITDAAILFWLQKLDIPRRNVSEAREIKHWGLEGKDNPMYGKVGSASSNWKGGITADRQAFYATKEWKKAVRQVYKRDQKVCQRCRKIILYGERVNIHHIISFRVVELRTEITNLITLCTSCHHWVHSKKNIGGQFIGKEVTE